MSNYVGYITKIKDVKKHSNADRLNIGRCFGNQVIVSKNTKSGDIGIYFPSGTKLGEEYAMINDLVRVKNEETGEVIKNGYLNKDKRHIRAMKLRGEISDGLFMPLKSLETFTDITKLKVGHEISKLNDVIIAEKYIPRNRKDGNVKFQSEKTKEINFKYNKFEQHINTKQLKYNLRQFKEGDLCTITLKMHGTSQRTTKTKPNIRKKWYEKLINKLNLEIKRGVDTVTGTRRVILGTFEGGYYGDNSFREKHHKILQGKLIEGETVYYEVVGYVDDEKPIMATCDNSKLGKDFVKQYGKETIFNYNCFGNQSEMYVYRMNLKKPNGDVVEYSWEQIKNRCREMEVKHVPEFETFVYTDEEDLLERVKKYIDGADPIGITHVREGVIVRIDRGNLFIAFKEKNFEFKVLEGIIKDSGKVEMEEQEEIEIGVN